MVGEIRDQETAEIAMTASQTGHLVLSTLHTNDSIATLDRLRDLGIPAFMIAASVTAIVSQRLLRKLCTCRVEGNVPIPPEYPELLAAPGSEPIKIYVPGGCPACDYTGYRGRVGVYEVLFISDDIRRLIQKDTGTEEIRTWTAAMHVPFMRENALDKVKEGLTSLDEVLRVVPMTERAAPVKQSARAPVNDRGKEHSVRYCHECGAELAASFSFCPGCGSKVRGLSIAPKPTGTLQGDVPA
jgi:type IV pilus assembly protein PilB